MGWGRGYRLWCVWICLGGWEDVRVSVDFVDVWCGFAGRIMRGSEADRAGYVFMYVCMNGWICRSKQCDSLVMSHVGASQRGVCVCEVPVLGLRNHAVCGCRYVDANPHVRR
jgi:hypothetical protein